MIASQAIHYLHTIPPAEPVFVLRGQDSLAWRAVLEWALLAEKAGVKEEKVCGAIRAMHDMLNWERRKLPD